MASYIWIGGTSTAYTTDANWDNAADGSDWTTRATTDIVYFDSNATNTSGVAGTSGFTTALAEFHQSMLYTYAMGGNGSPLKVQSPKFLLGEPSGSSSRGSGSGRINLNTDTTSCEVFIFDSSTASTDTGKEPVRIKGAHTSNIVNIDGGRVGIATDSYADTASIGTINVTNGTTNIASGTTLVTLNVSGGTCNLNCGATTVNASGGTLTTNGNVAITTMTIWNTTVTADHRKTTAGDEITTLNLYEGAILDVSSLSTAFAVGAIKYARYLGTGTPMMSGTVSGFAKKGSTSYNPGFGTAASTTNTPDLGYSATFTIDTGVTIVTPIIVTEVNISVSRIRAGAPVTLSWTATGVGTATTDYPVTAWA